MRIVATRLIRYKADMWRPTGDFTIAVMIVSKGILIKILDNTIGGKLPKTRPRNMGHTTWYATFRAAAGEASRLRQG